tara:strand:+ start:41 stop:202 length:162 start_codon:yes stop_codon:yes gene_type:complete
MESKATESKTGAVDVVSLIKKAKEARSIEKRNNLFIVLAFTAVLIVTGLIISL